MTPTLPGPSRHFRRSSAFSSTWFAADYGPRFRLSRTLLRFGCIKHGAGLVHRRLSLTRPPGQAEIRAAPPRFFRTQRRWFRCQTRRQPARSPADVHLFILLPRHQSAGPIEAWTPTLSPRAPGAALETVGTAIRQTSFRKEPENCSTCAALFPTSAPAGSRG